MDSKQGALSNLHRKMKPAVDVNSVLGVANPTIAGRYLRSHAVLARGELPSAAGVLLLRSLPQKREKNMIIKVIRRHGVTQIEKGWDSNACTPLDAPCTSSEAAASQEHAARESI